MALVRPTAEATNSKVALDTMAGTEAQLCKIQS